MIVARDVAVPADTVFAVLADPSAQCRWIVATRLHSDGLGGIAPPHVGSSLIAHTGFGPLALADPMRVEVYQPPRRWRVVHTGSVIRGWGEMGTLPRASGCRVYWAEEFEVPGGAVGAIAWWAIGHLVRGALAVSLDRLVRGVDSGRLVGPGRPGRLPRVYPADSGSNR